MIANTRRDRPQPMRSITVRRSECADAFEFARSAELGGYLTYLAREQIEIDRREKERLDRLRALQDRD